MRYYHRPGHPRASPLGFVSAADLDDVPDDRGHVPVVSDLYMDGVRALDGSDIGSRRKRREYQRARGLADVDDFKGVVAEAVKLREDAVTTGGDHRERRQAVDEAARRAIEMPQARYDRELRQRDAVRAQRTREFDSEP